MSDEYLLRLSRAVGSQKALGELLGVGEKCMCKLIAKDNCLKLQYLQELFDLCIEWLDLSTLVEQIKLVKHFVCELIHSEDLMILKRFTQYVQHRISEIPLFFDIEQKKIEHLVIGVKTINAFKSDELILSYDSHLPLLVDEVQRVLSPLPLLQTKSSKRAMMVDVYMIDTTQLMNGKKQCIELQYYSIISKVLAIDSILDHMIQKKNLLQQEKIWELTHAFGFADPDLYWMSREIILKGCPLLIDAFQHKVISVLAAQKIALLPAAAQAQALYSFAGAPRAQAERQCINVNKLVNG